MAPKSALRMRNRWQKYLRALCSCTKTMPHARTRLSFRRGRKTSATSSSMKSQISSRISSTRCSAKTASKMPRRRSAMSKECWGSPIWRSLPRLRRRKCSQPIWGKEINMANASQYGENDPRHHSANLRQMLTDVINHARADVKKVNDAKAQALFETTAEVLTGLRKAYDDYE